MLYIGIDLGTSSVKLLLMDGEGNIQNTVCEEYPISFPKPGWSEQNPEDWYNAVIEGIKKLTYGIDNSKLAGISFGGQMHIFLNILWEMQRMWQIWFTNLSLLQEL